MNQCTFPLSNESSKLLLPSLTFVRLLTPSTKTECLIPLELIESQYVVDANQVMYKEIFALVLTPKGEKLARSRLTLVF